MATCLSLEGYKSVLGHTGFWAQLQQRRSGSASYHRAVLTVAESCCWRVFSKIFLVLIQSNVSRIPLQITSLVASLKCATTCSPSLCIDICNPFKIYACTYIATSVLNFRCWISSQDILQNVAHAIYNKTILKIVWTLQYRLWTKLLSRPQTVIKWQRWNSMQEIAVASLEILFENSCLYAVSNFHHLISM